MMYLIWALLNIALLIYFLNLCFKATKLLKEKLGLFAAIVFVIGLISLNTHTTYSDNNKHQNSWEFYKKDSIDYYSASIIDITLEDNLISEKKLTLAYAKENKSQQYIPLNSSSYTIGFIGGTKWQPTSIIVNPTFENHQFKYHVTGKVEWKISALTIYTQIKTFTGLVNVESQSE